MYTSQADVTAYLQRELTASEAITLNPLISAVEKYIDSETGRRFIKTGSIARYFDGTGAKELFIDDAVAITQVAEYDPETQLSTVVASSEYITRPYNKLPISSIEFINGGLSRGTKNIKITGEWGYCTTVPDDIKAIATFLVAQFYINPENLKNENIEGYSRAFTDLLPPLFKSILDNLVKVTI